MWLSKSRILIENWAIKDQMKSSMQLSDIVKLDPDLQFQNPSIVKLYLVYKRRSADSEALNS